MPASPILVPISADLATLLSRIPAAAALSTQVDALEADTTSIKASLVDGVLATAGKIGNGTNRSTLISVDGVDSGDGPWRLHKKITVACKNGSEFYITWESTMTGGYTTPRTEIRKNGVSIGDTKVATPGAGWEAWNSTVTGINLGDTLEVWVQGPESGGTIQTRNFRLIGVPDVGTTTMGAI